MEPAVERKLDALLLWALDRLINQPNPLPSSPVPFRRNFWIYLYLHFNIDSRWQRNAWMKICEKTQQNLDRDNHVWLWEKSVLLNK